MIELRRDVPRAVIRRGIATGVLRPDTDVELTVALLAGPMMTTLLGSNPRLDTERLAERVVDTVLAGIAAGPARSAEPTPGAGRLASAARAPA
jgi:AcrR family transcriptional regulator